MKLKEIQEKGPLSFKNVCLNFYNNSKFQVGKEIIDVNQFDRIESITTIYSGDENGFATHFKSGDVYTYAKLKDSDKEFAMVKAKEWIPYREIKKDIKIEDKKYASSYIVIGDGAEEIKINQVRISFDENKVHFEIKGNVYERIKSIQFILALLKNQYIMVGDYKLNLPLNNQEKVEESIKLYEKELEYYNMVKNAFGVFNTKFDIPYENLSEDDEKQLFVLIGLFNGRIREDIKVLHKYYICINKYKFLFMILRDKKTIINFYSQKALDHIIRAYEISGKMVKTSLYSSLNEDDILDVSNFNDKIIMKSFKGIPFTEELMIEVNNLILTFIKLYNKTKNKLYINLADKLSQINTKNRNDDIDIINAKQIKKIKNTLSSRDKKYYMR